jgi:hypothetical protein
MDTHSRKKNENRTTNKEEKASLLEVKHYVVKTSSSLKYQLAEKARKRKPQWN